MKVNVNRSSWRKGLGSYRELSTENSHGSIWRYWGMKRVPFGGQFYYNIVNYAYKRKHRTYVQTCRRLNLDKQFP